MTYQADEFSPDDNPGPRAGVGRLVDPQQLAQLVMAARAAQQVGRGAALMPRGAQNAEGIQIGPQLPAQSAVLPPTTPFASEVGPPGPQASPPANPDPAKAAAIQSIRQAQASPQSSAAGYNQSLKERIYAPEGTRGHELMDNTLVQGESYNLFQASMYGNDRREHSMWVVSKDGQYSFVRWPWSAERDKEEWKGPAPDGAVAVVHTHPTATGEKPSDVDRNLAKGKAKKGNIVPMPVYVLHKNGIWKADPGGGKDIRVRDYRWVDEFKDGGDSGR